MFLLWEDAGSVIGFAAFFPDDHDLSVFVTPAYAETDDAISFEDEAEAWASRGTALLRWTEFDDEAAAVRRWQGRGHRLVPGGYPNLIRRLDAAPLHVAPDDRVQPVGDDDVADRAGITHAAFEEAEPLAKYLSDYRSFRSSPAYPRGWDLVLRDEAGRPAACCIAWLDPVSKAATFEPVATHPAMLRRGFGRALLQEGCRRLAAAAMTYVIIGVDINNAPAMALYRSVGFGVDRVLRTYERS
jgi:ribosomal protein S18 acetylase RimI-like enzyme